MHGQWPAVGERERSGRYFGFYWKSGCAQQNMRVQIKFPLYDNLRIKENLFLILQK